MCKRSKQRRGRFTGVDLCHVNYEQRLLRTLTPVYTSEVQAAAAGKMGSTLFAYCTSAMAPKENNGGMLLKLERSF